MLRPLDRFDPRSVEEETRKFWAIRSLPPSGGTVGPTAGPRVHQLFGTLSREESPFALLQRAVLADVEARFLAQAGRRTSGRVQVRQRGLDSNTASAGELLRRIGVWMGGGVLQTISTDTASDRLQTMVERLAETNLLVSREAPLRSCPRCRVPRTPAGIVYEEADGPTYLVRFPLPGTTPRSSLLVWVDSLWKLLGTTALLVHPDQSYVRAAYRRHGSEETVILSRTGADRLRQWLPGGELEVLSEAPGTSFEGQRYEHPLSHEAPGLGSIEGPAGVVHASPEVTDTGTGVVTLVPSHGAGDAAVGRSLGVAGWPILDADLTLSTGFAHKYQGLAIDAADAFIQRDLSDGGYLFAQLTVRRGIPHCAVCGEPLVWETGRAWCLEPGRLPSERLDLLGRLLPHEPIPPPQEAVPWPVSEGEMTDEDAAPLLLDCRACGRLAAPMSGPTCPCGGERSSGRRRLLPVFQETLVAWAREAPFPPGEALRLYVADRRHMPSVIHHLVAMEAVEAHPGEVRLGVFPTLPAEQVQVGSTEPLDALRATLAGLASTPRAGAVSLADRRVAEERRVGKIWSVVRDVLATMIHDGYAPTASPIGGRLAELLDEDRAFLSRFERLRAETLRLFEQGRLGLVHAHLTRFFERELRDGYLPFVRRRLQATGLPPDKAGAYSVLAHVLPLWAELYGPIAPFTAEAIHRAFRGDSESLFERPFTPILEGILDAKAERAYDRWRSVTRALDRARRHLGLPSGTPLEKVVLFIRDEESADGLRASSELLARVANVGVVEVTSPNLPWEGKRVDAQPVLPAIQKAFGTSTPRVVRLLSGLPGRRVQEGIRSRSLQVAVEGRPVEILPSMVEFVESLPEGVVPIPWELGELYIELPASANVGEQQKAPALSPDAYRLVRRVRHRLRQSARLDPPPGLVVFARGRLADELERQQTALTRVLGIVRIRVVASPEGFPPAETLVGRSGRGDPWMVWVPGVPAAPPRQKLRTRQGVKRSGTRAPEAEGTVVDYLAAPVLTRENELQEWVKRLDIVLGRPVVGPSKLRYAWEVGIHSYDDLVHASYERLAPIPGFGPHVAAEIVRSFGGTVPERPRAHAEAGPVVYEKAPPAPSTGRPRMVDDLQSPPVPPASSIDQTPESEVFGPRDERPAPEPPLPDSGRPDGSLDRRAGEPPIDRQPPGTIGISPDLGETLPPGVEPEPARESPSDAGPPTAEQLALPASLESTPPAAVPSDIEAMAPAEPVADSAEPPTQVVSPTGDPAGTSETPELSPPTLAAPPPERPTAELTEEHSQPALMVSAPTSTPEPSASGLGDSLAPPPGSPEEGSPPSPDLLTEGPGDGADSEPIPATPTAGDVAVAPPDAADSNPVPLPSSEGGSPRPSGGGADVLGPPVGGEPVSTLADRPPTAVEVPERPATEATSEVEPVVPSPETEPSLPLAEPELSPTSLAPEVAPERPVPAPRSGVMVSSDSGEGGAWPSFLDATAAGHRGLCLSREFPDRLRALLGPRDVTIVWLSNAGRPGSAKPGDLDGLRAAVGKAIEAEAVTAVYVDSVEFLIRINSVGRVLDFLHQLHDLAAPRSIRIWVPVNPALASAADAEALASAFAGPPESP